MKSKIEMKRENKIKSTINDLDTEAGPSFPEVSGTDDSVSGLILFNNLSYNLYSFI